MTIEGKRRVPKNLIKEGLAIGVELECIIPRASRNCIHCECKCKCKDESIFGCGKCTCDKLRAGKRGLINKLNKKPYKQYISVVGDSSITGDGSCIEVRVLDRIDKMDILKDVLKEIKKVKGFVNKSCGTHVHFDQRGVKYKEVLKKTKRLEASQSFLKQLVSRDRSGGYSPIQNSNFIYTGEKDLKSSERCFINHGSYRSKKTIEVRGHQGTLNFIKLRNWINLCNNIMNEAVEAPISWKDFVALYGNSILTKHIRERYKKFNKKNLRLVS